MKEYQVRYIFTVKALDRFDAVRKVNSFLPETDNNIVEYYTFAVKPRTCVENCIGCEEYDEYGCMYQAVNQGECKREPLSSEAKFK